MSQKWNLQDIKPPENRRRKPSTERAAPPTQEKSEPKATTSSRRPAKKSRARELTISVIIFILLAGAGFFASAYLTGATVTVFPRTSSPTVNANFTAYQEPQAGELSYEIMILEAESERQVAASGQENVSTSAEGAIEIYKTTSGSQRLIKNTRFESPEGNIYKITESVVVPGGTTDTPGTVKANVFAEAPGAQYNLDQANLTVPGLESDPVLFKAIHAEVISPITGGFEGMRAVVDESELAGATGNLHEELKDTLIDRMAGEKPAGFVLFPAAATITYETLPAVEGDNGQALIKEKAILRIPLFKEDKFAAYIAAATIPGYENRPVRINDYNALTFAYTTGSTTETDISTLESVSFSLTGKPLIVWTYDHDQLTKDLAGSPKTALQTILSGYPGIERAQDKIRPFWKKSYPDNPDEIEIVEVLGSSSTETE